MKNRFLRDKRGISPVVAIVILTAVTSTTAITVAVAMTNWMGGIALLYTRFESLEITSAYPTYSSDAGNWTVTINLKNSGSVDVTINFVLINGKPLSEFDGYGKVMTALSKTIKIGQEDSIKLQLKRGGSFTAGTTIEIKLLSASGQEYLKAITLN